MSNLTRILSEIETGDPPAAEQLLPLVYDELRKQAATKLEHEKPGQTLQATTLVHDAYHRRVHGEIVQQWLRCWAGSEASRPLCFFPHASI